MVLYSPDWTTIGFSFILLTVNLFRHSTLIEHGLKCATDNFDLKMYHLNKEFANFVFIKVFCKRLKIILEFHAYCYPDRRNGGIAQIVSRFSSKQRILSLRHKQHDFFRPFHTF